MSDSLTLPQMAGLQTSTYFNVAGIAVLVYDYAITFEDEVRLVWGRGWDPTRFFFTVSRYLPFAGVGMTAYSALRPSSKPCAPKEAENILHILGIIAAEMLLIIRTYVFWQCDKRVLYGLIAYGCVTIAVAVAFNVAPIIPEGNLPVNCLIASRNGTFVYLPLLVFEMVVLFLMAYKHFQAYRAVRAHIVRTIYWDGVLYILSISLITLANVIIDGVFPIQFSDLLDTFQITIHSVLSSRIMFNLRKSTQRPQKGTTDLVTLSEIAYHAPSGSQSTEPESSESSRVHGVTNVYIDEDTELERFEPRRDSSSISMV